MLGTTWVAYLPKYYANSAQVLFTFLMRLKLSPPLKCCTNVHAKLSAQSTVGSSGGLGD